MNCKCQLPLIIIKQIQYIYSYVISKLSLYTPAFLKKPSDSISKCAILKKFPGGHAPKPPSNSILQIYQLVWQEEENIWCKRLNVAGQQIFLS